MPKPNAGLLAPDPAVPQRDRLLDPQEMLHHLRALYPGRRIETPLIVRITYRVGDSLHILYRIRMPGFDDVLVTAGTFPAGSRALDVKGATQVARGTAGWPLATAIPELGTAFWMFPWDRNLCQIEALLRPSPDLSAELGGAWTRSQLEGYEPAKSAVVACLGTGDEPLAYAKLYGSPYEAGRAFDLHQEAWKGASGRPGLRVPRPLSFKESRHVVITEAARGTRLTELDTAQSPRSASRLGAAIAQFHGMAVPSSAPRCRRSSAPSLRRAADLIGTARPEVRAAVAALVDDLVASAPEDTEAVLIHGEPHPKNALIDGDDLWLINLDRVAKGAGASDIGSFLAFLRSSAVAGVLAWNDLELLEREFLGAYGNVRPLPPQRVIDWHTSAALLGERALGAISRVSVPMLRNLDELMDEARRVLRRGGDGTA